jgi:hypothetical protein
MSKLKVEIDNHSFVRSHGHQPRGRGCWAFEIIDQSNIRGGSGSGEVVTTVFAPSSTLREAKLWVTAFVRKNYAAELATGCLYVSVGP